MGQLFTKIKAKEDEKRQQIEQFEEKSNLKAFNASLKKVLNQFGCVNKKIESEFLEIANRMASVKETKTSEKIECLKDTQEIHSKIERILKDNTDKFNQFFEEIRTKEQQKKLEKKQDKIK